MYKHFCGAILRTHVCFDEPYALFYANGSIKEEISQMPFIEIKILQSKTSFKGGNPLFHPNSKEGPLVPLS